MKKSNPDMAANPIIAGEEKDCANHVGNFLYFLAGLSIASMLLSPLIFDTFQFELSPFVNVVAGSMLKKRSNAARMIVIVIYSLGAFLILLAFGSVLVGFSNDLKIFGAPVPKKPLVLVPIAMSFFLLLIYPVVILTSKGARKQFETDGPGLEETQEIGSKH